MMSNKEREQIKISAMDILRLVDEIYQDQRGETECSIDDAFKAVELAILSKRR